MGGTKLFRYRSVMSLAAALGLFPMISGVRTKVASPWPERGHVLTGAHTQTTHLVTRKKVWTS